MNLKEIAFRYESPAMFLKVKDFPHIFLKKAKGVYFWDVEGKKYLDMTSFFGVMNFGHSPDFIFKDIIKNKEILIHGLSDLFSNFYRVKLAEKICNLVGKDYEAIFLNTGSEAIEISLKTAYLYTKKNYIISFKNSYHGLTGLSLSITDRFQKKFFLPFLYKKVKLFPFPENEIQAEKVICKIKNLVKKIPVLGIVIEPIQVRGGINIPPQFFLKDLYEICKKEGLVLILDEIFTGLGRTGKIFAFEWFNIKPDIVCIGKGIASGFPLSACVGKKEIMEVWKKDMEETLHASTFGGHPFSSLIAIKILDRLKKMDFEKEIILKGDYIFKKFSELKEKYKIIKNIKGKGLLIGARIEKAKEIWKELIYKEKILTILEGKDLQVLTLSPPFIIDYSKIDEFFEKFEKVIKRRL
jgi:acetylornithine/succinyldiaminopimelate/putrescine aminotransferase